MIKYGRFIARMGQRDFYHFHLAGQATISFFVSIFYTDMAKAAVKQAAPWRARESRERQGRLKAIAINPTVK